MWAEPQVSVSDHQHRGTNVLRGLVADGDLSLFVVAEPL
jgi:hypothetical protein